MFVLPDEFNVKKYRIMPVPGSVWSGIDKQALI